MVVLHEVLVHQGIKYKSWGSSAGRYLVVDVVSAAEVVEGEVKRLLRLLGEPRGLRRYWTAEGESHKERASQPIHSRQAKHTHKKGGIAKTENTKGHEKGKNGRK